MSDNVLEIHTQVPTRIDLAGGTLDLWPLYLFLDNPTTINLAINLYAETNLKLSKGKGRITLQSLDQKQEVRLTLLNRNKINIPSSLVLHEKLLDFFLTYNKVDSSYFQDKNITLSTTSQSPAGAGLGGSSSLCVSILGAFFELGEKLNIIKKTRFHLEELITIVKDTETQVINVPAGLQDYYAATYGGLQCLSWKTPKTKRTCLSKKTALGLEKRLLVFYSGKSRQSGLNNWLLFKNFIDQMDLKYRDQNDLKYRDLQDLKYRDPKDLKYKAQNDLKYNTQKNHIKSKFQAIANASSQLYKALLQEDWKKIGLAIQEEWNTRQT
ncbi:MAG: hypothetical protein HY072_07225, partial [Deltaproteobacteria bacterium]|nr:hypothetical protein [Deltaproteobacteria bacterium]